MALRTTFSVPSGGGVAGTTSVGLLAKSGVAASVTGSVTETTLATIAIPAGALKANGSLRVWTLCSCTNNANAKTLNVRLGGTLVNSGQALASAASFQGESIISNRNATNSQISNASLVDGVSTSPNVATAVDMTVVQNLTITGTLGTSTDTLTLEAYIVEIINP